MGRAPCCSKVGLHRGPWTPTEDTLLTTYIQNHGEGQWRSLPKNAGLLRCGKSCRLRWMNYLRPDIKRGGISPDEDDLIIRLHALLGNRWSLIAGRLPGRTDNEIKNYWNTHLSKQLRSQGTDPNTHKKLSDLERARPKPKPKNKKTRAINTTPEEKQQVVHQPKPIRVTSLQLVSASLSSNASFDSGLTTVSPSTSNVVPPCWPPYDLCGAAPPTYDIQEEEDVAGPPPAASDLNMLDKLYQEYFQLIKGHHHGHGHGLGLDLDLDLGVDHARELDSFAESLLV
ncbi:hypothetical protein V2J09_024341 [Rumex salicifolius]